MNLLRQSSARPALLLGQKARRPVSVRSVLLGFAGVVLLCALTPYNNYVVNNTDIVGNALPCGVLAFFLLVVLLVNGPLSRFAPRFALTRGELAVALGMMLVSCALPAVGLMRYLPGHLVSFWAHASNSDEYRKLMQELDLPQWLFPKMATQDLASRGNDPVVRDFVLRAPVDQDAFWAHWQAVPWAAWARPAVFWGLFVAALFGAVICLSLIFRRQWVENERIGFPLASIYVSLIDSPERGRWLNRLLSRRSFWVAFMIVFVVHGISALSRYAPRYCPPLPLSFNLSDLMADEPLKYTEWFFKTQTLSFTLVGIIYFLDSRLAFSLWFFYVAQQVARMAYGMHGMEITGGMIHDQIFGALVPMGIVILFVGRHHLLSVARQMFRSPRPDEPRGRYLPYGAAGWGLVLSLGALAGWLVAAGASPIGAIVLVLMLMLFYLVLAKTVAQTGLLYVLIPVPLNQPWIYALNELPQALATRTTLRSYFFGGMFSGVLTHDLRQALPVYSTHALRVADESAYEGERNWRRAAPFIACLVAALLVAYAVSGASTLYTHYSHDSTLDVRHEGLDHNGWGWYSMPRYYALDMTRAYVPPATSLHDRHSRLGHFAFGAALTTGLSVLRLRYANWPLHPVGFLLCYTWGIQVTWFSILAGWLAKVTLVKWGGAGLYSKARPFFLGIILGETAAAAFWLIVSLVCASAGWDFQAIQLMPT